MTHSSHYTLYLITDRELLRGRDLCQAVALAIESGVTLVQLREKNAGSRDVLEIGRRVLDVTRRHGVPLIINDRVDIMLALDADGVHLGPNDLPPDVARGLIGERIMGCSVNTCAELAAAETAGADYVGVGPVFATTTKANLRPTLGVQRLRDIVAKARIPCVAIGGITPENAAQVAATGVAGVCAISAILGANDIPTAVRRFRAALASASPASCP